MTRSTSGSFRQQPRAVFFDVGGTMLRPSPSVGAVYAATAREHGFVIDDSWIENRFHQEWKLSLARSRERGYTCSDAILREEWFRIVSATFADKVPEDGIRGVFDDLYRKFASPSAWSLADGVRDTLDQLRADDLKLGILSNWDSGLMRTLKQFDLARFFDLFVVSHEVGHEKPHAEIFREAIRRAGEEPSAILHVGDSWEADICPARQLGLQTLWIAPSEERRRRGEAENGVNCFTSLSTGWWRG